jgi:hypothetical protein
VPPSGSSLLTAAASPKRHAVYSAWAEMGDMIVRLGSRGTERRGGGGAARAGWSEASNKLGDVYLISSHLAIS